MGTPSISARKKTAAKPKAPPEAAAKAVPKASAAVAKNGLTGQQLVSGSRKRMIIGGKQLKTFDLRASFSERLKDRAAQRREIKALQKSQQAAVRNVKAGAARFLGEVAVSITQGMTKVIDAATVAKRNAAMHDVEQTLTQLILSLPDNVAEQVAEKVATAVRLSARSATTSETVRKPLGKSRAAKGAESAAVSTSQFMSELRRQTQDSMESDIEDGKLISARELAQRLGVTTQALSVAVSKNRMFSLLGPSGHRYYPAFFADQMQYDRDVLENVSKTLGDIPAGAKWKFFTVPRTSLGKRTPLEALTRGEVEAVLNAAAAVAERP